MVKALRFGVRALWPDEAPTRLPGAAYPDWDAIYADNVGRIYRLMFAKVGNRPDAEDLTQQVAMKAIPRLRQGAAASSIRAYLFATARSVLAQFWSVRLGLGEEELHEDFATAPPSLVENPQSVERVQRVLEQLPANYRRVLELRFLRGYSLKEVARETGSTVGGVKVMQLRALRAAARLSWDA